MCKLRVVVTRFLFLCTVLLALPTVVDAQLTVERVWTRDENGNDKATFVPNEAIQYVTLINNTSSQPVKMRIRFEAAGPGVAGNPAYRSIYLYIQRDVDVPVGLTGYYSPWTIPASAQPGLYGVGIDICWDETSVTTGSSCSGTSTVNYGSFSIPGTLATDITTFLSDGVTPTSAAGTTVGPGSALVYKITVTNISSSDNADVVLTDPLPPEIFDIIGMPTTDHGTCDKTGSWPSTTVTCPLGNLAPGETATIYFTASIIVRDPSGAPRPPGNFVNKVYVRSDQQSSETSSFAKTVINIEDISCEDFNKFVETAENCVGIVPVIGTLAGFVWRTVGRPMEGCQPESYPGSLVKAVELGSKEMSQVILNEIGHKSGLKEVTPDLGTAECIIAGWKFFHDTH